MINHNQIKTKMTMTEASGSLGPVFGPVEKCGAIKPIIGIHICVFFRSLNNKTHINKNKILQKFASTYICIYNYGVRVLVFNATFQNISVISLRSVLLVEKTTDLSQVTLSHINILLHDCNLACICLAQN